MDLEQNTMRECKDAGGYQGLQTVSLKHNGQLLINKVQPCKPVTIHGPCHEGEEIPVIFLSKNDWDVDNFCSSNPTPP